MKITHLNQIDGGKIIQVGVTEGYPGLGQCLAKDLWQILVVEKDGKTFLVEVGRDPEGSGPGHLFIEASEATDREYLFYAGMKNAYIGEPDEEKEVTDE